MKKEEMFLNSEMISSDWHDLLKDEFSKDYFLKLNDKVMNEYTNEIVFPKKEEIFNALNFTSYKDTKVVIIGQDPYHGINEAHGLCFSVNKDVKIPPSLRNIYKEIKNDLGIDVSRYGYLKKWTDEGVLLLNAVLTVRCDMAESHSKFGWQNFTDQIIRLLNEKNEPVVFLLWGNYARSKKELITNKRHLILEAVHPSPLSASRGFFGCKHFSKTNEFLKANGMKEIDWKIDEE